MTFFLSQTMDKDCEYIAFVGNDCVLTKSKSSNQDIFKILSIDNKREPIEFSLRVADSVIFDQKKERVIIYSSYGNLLNHLMLYDSKAKDLMRISKSEISLLQDMGFGVLKDMIRVCFDEENPTSILINENPDDLIISYDYETKISNEIGRINELCNEKKLLNSQHIFDAASKKRWIIFQDNNTEESNTIKCCEFFSGAFELKYTFCHDLQFQNRTICFRGMRTDYDCDFICDKNRFFMVITLSLGRDHIDIENLKVPNIANGAYIFNIKKNTSIHLRDENKNPVLLYAMKLHPNNKIVAGISIYDGILRYWFLDGGLLLARDNLLSPYGGMGMGWCMSKGKNQFDISPDGQKVAFINKNNERFFDMPFEVRCGLNKSQISFIWWVLNNEIQRLPREIIHIIFKLLGS